MDTLTVILVIAGSLIGGFTLAFWFFFMITYFIDWRLKRKQKKLTNKELLKPNIEENEKGVIEENGKRKFIEYRQFEKLRRFGEGERSPSKYDGITERNNIQKPVNRINNTNSDNVGKFKSNFR